MSIAITSRHGSAHITPAQDSMWHRAIFGLDTCVIADDKTLNFEADIQSNNEVRVRSGIAMLQGRFWCVPIGTYDPLTIQNGNQGEKRIDLAVQRWTITEETNTQSCDWVVIMGTPTTGEAEVPSHVEGDLDNGDTVADMPMFQITLDGINLTAVTPVFVSAISTEAARISDKTKQMFAAAGYPIE